jgi:hypothetical protein
MKSLSKTFFLLSLSLFTFARPALAYENGFQRIKDKASYRIHSLKERFNNTIEGNSPVHKASGSFERDYQVEPEISHTRSSGQFEAQIDQMILANWQKPEKISDYQWNRILLGTKRVSKRTGIPQQLIMSLVSKESGFNPYITSRSGAVGLTQLMPVTAQNECGLSREELNDIDKNLQCGIGYLEKQMRYFGKLDLAVAAYNAGPGAVRRAIEKSGSKELSEVTPHLKPETAPYVRKILASINYGNDFI